MLMDEFYDEILMDVPRIRVFDSGSLSIEVSQRVPVNAPDRRCPVDRCMQFLVQRNFNVISPHLDRCHISSNQEIVWYKFTIY